MYSEDKFIIKDFGELKRFEVLNKNVIRAIIELDDQKFTEELITQFLKKADQTIAEIDLSIKRKKTSETSVLANALKGSSLYIGTEKITALSSFIYENARKRNITPLKEATDLLREVFYESKTVLLELIESNTDAEVS